MLDEQRDSQSDQAERSADGPIGTDTRKNADEAAGGNSETVETKSSTSEDALTTDGPASTLILGTEARRRHGDDSRGESDADSEESDADN